MNVFNNIIELKSKEGVVTHIEMLQNIIEKLGDKGAECKKWYIAILSAVIVFVLGDTTILTKSNILICFVPTILFCFLNCYYLGQSRIIRNYQKLFVLQINENVNTFDGKNIYKVKNYLIVSEIESDEITKISSNIYKGDVKWRNDLKATLYALLSLSILGFYGLSSILIILVWYFSK